MVPWNTQYASYGQNSLLQRFIITSLVLIRFTTIYEAQDSCFLFFINGFCKLPIDFQCTHPSICLFPCATFRSLVSSLYCLLNTEFHQSSICLFHQSFYISFMSSPCLQVLRFKHLPKCKALIFIKDTISPLTGCRGIPVYTFPPSLKYTFHYYSLFSVIYPIC